jgi:hypothetical protein
MNLWAMVALTAVITTEKLAPAGRLVARVVGIASIALSWLLASPVAVRPGCDGGQVPAQDPTPGGPMKVRLTGPQKVLFRHSEPSTRRVQHHLCGL